MPKQELADKVVVVTGASSGFGKGVALELARARASVVLAARRDALLDALAQECQDLGGRALAVPTDVSIHTDMEHLAAATLAEFGAIDVWINNAGVGALGRFDLVPLADHVQVIETDLLGTMYGSYFAVRHFAARRSGTLINVASMLGRVPTPYYASYAAAKHGVVGLTAALRLEIAEQELENVHVCTVLPTSMDTPFFDHAANYTGHEASPVPPLYDADKTVDVIVRLCTEPEDEVTVGSAAAVANAMHRVTPNATEHVLARQTHREQMEKAPPAPDTSGSVHEPLQRGTDVTGGRLDT
jgi:short-subunit dehydrogenase